MAIDIRQAHRRVLEEAFGKGQVEVFDEVCDTAYRDHDPVTGDGDLRRAKETCRMYRTAFPDLKPTIISSWADGDTAVTHWRMSGTHQGHLMGIDPTGKRCIVEGISIAKFRRGKLVESWVQWDALGLMRQLGVAPETGARSTEPTSETRPRL